MSYRFPGPICCINPEVSFDIDSGTLCRSTSPIPGFTPNPITDADKAEFKIVQKMPVLSSKAERYTTVEKYVADRNRFFGSSAAYTTFAIESDAELANTEWVGKKRTTTLRSMIEHGDKPQQQQILYRWLRKAYKNKYGNDADVPAIIRKGMSEGLAEKLKEIRASVRVKKIHDEDFHAGGFNPRPKKLNGRYRLGTLSEHASGLAVDIDPDQNPQLTIPEWNFILNLVGKTMVRKGRWDTEEHAEALYKDFANISDLFVAKVASEVTRIEQQRAKDKAEAEKTGAKPKSGPVKTPLQEVLGAHFGTLSKFSKTGFLKLPLELVLEFHDHGFTWGATFSDNVDIQHFELPDDD